MPYLLQTTSSASLKDVTLSSGISYIRSGGAGYTGDWSLKFKCQISGTSLLILAGDAAGVADSTNLIFFTTGTNLQIRTAGAQRNLTLPQSAITAARVYELVGSSASNDIKVYQDGSYVGAVAGVSLFSTDVRVIYPLLNNTGRYGDLYYVELYNNGALTNHYLNTTGTGSVWIDQVSGNNATQTGTWPVDDSEWVFYDTGGGTAYEDTLSGASYSASVGSLVSTRGFNDTLNGISYSGAIGDMIAARGYASELNGVTCSATVGSLSSLRGYSSLLSAADYGAAIGNLISTLDGAIAYSDFLSGFSSSVALGDLVSSVQRSSILNGLAYGFSVGDLTASLGYSSALSGFHSSSSIGQLTSTVSGEVTVTIEGYTISFVETAVAAVYAVDSISVQYAQN